MDQSHGHDRGASKTSSLVTMMAWYKQPPMITRVFMRPATHWDIPIKYWLQCLSVWITDSTLSVSVKLFHYYWLLIQELIVIRSGAVNYNIYRMVKESNSNIWPNQTIVSDQSELTILLCQPMTNLLLMKTTLPWFSSLQLLPSYIHDPWLSCTFV